MRFHLISSCDKKLRIKLCMIWEIVEKILENSKSAGLCTNKENNSLTSMI